MAIFHFSVQLIKRSEGRSSVNASAYRSGEKIKDDRLDKTFNYSKKEVHDSFIMTPPNTPESLHDRYNLWNEVEKTEKRKDAQVAREINLALPVELGDEEQKNLLIDFIQRNFVDKGMIADCAIHKDNPSNPHAHIMLTTRDISKIGFGKKNREWNNKQLIEDWRKDWSVTVNESLKLNGINEQIDHRSHKARGLKTNPQIHEGPRSRDMHKRGKFSDRVHLNNNIKESNLNILRIQQEIEETKKQLASTFEEALPTQRQNKIDEILMAAKSKREEAAKTSSKSAIKNIERIRLINEYEDKILNCEKGIKKINNLFKELNELPEIIKGGKEEISNLKSKKTFLRISRSSQYQKTLTRKENEIQANIERYEYLKSKMSELHKDRTKLLDKKLEFQKAITALKVEKNLNLYNIKSENKKVDKEL